MLSELNSSINSLCKFAQLDSFKEKYNLLKNNKQLSSQNKLINPNPFYNTHDALLRVGGRLSNSFYDYDTKHPIFLDSRHHLATLIFRHYHILLRFLGPQMLLSTVRYKFWILNGRNLATKIVHAWVTCCRFTGKTHQPIMGNLPKHRLHADYPFRNTAVDYAGPVTVDTKPKG